jgi:GNAT superfamily N-acetyltransferase
MTDRTVTRPVGPAQAGGRTPEPARIGMFAPRGLPEQAPETARASLAHASDGLTQHEEHRPLPDDARRCADRAGGQVVVQNPGPLHHGGVHLVDRLRDREFVKPGQIGWTGGRATAAIRAAHPEDLAALGDFFAGLSPRTRYLRFFGPVTPGPALLRQLCGLPGTVDAVVAVPGGIIVGHAMAVDRTCPGGARVADIGVVVTDAWQGRGLGSALMRALVTRAQARGVTLLEMDVLDGNRQVIDMITSHWPAARVERSPDSISIRIRLQQHQQQHQQVHTRPAPAGRGAASRWAC